METKLASIITSASALPQFPMMIDWITCEQINPWSWCLITAITTPTKAEMGESWSAAVSYLTMLFWEDRRRARKAESTLKLVTIVGVWKIGMLSTMQTTEAWFVKF